MTRYAELAAEYGTPLYVYDLDRVAEARRALFAALPESFELYYAMKANPHPEVAAVLREDPDRACRAEISSTGELAAALAAGFPAGDCLYTGPGKTAAELDAAIGAGVRTFSVESPGDLRHIGAAARRHGAVADCLLRINSVSASASTSIRMTGAPSQFGIDRETLDELLPELLRVPGTRIAGAHFFPLSNAKDEASLLAEFEHTLAVAAELRDTLGLPVRLLDIGGGFAMPYGVPGERPRYDKLRSGLEAALDARFPDWREGTPRFACESGRYLVGGCGELLCGVVNVKESRGRGFAILDGGINVFGGMAGLGRLLPVAVRPSGAEASRRATLAGPLCTPGDFLGREVEVPPLAEGDVVAVPNAGAYGVTASLLMFLGRPAATEVVVRGGEVVSVSRIEHRRNFDVPRAGAHR
ncbi:decarboxylase [Allonocardiopsis opalescens]|uniref:Diaminopimelate decarboxylase n=1 Tax=Allonocardiopsis opalescens TaxID=1144618 RepID=A0A2T0QD08_9ACTN|nr:decarboxylase [Allonocardiopsis opalescens]PRY01761.1 diaminopimelate decarboxylase [Allonocardiopsis opalescens]